jgi:hypothetical protein
MKKVVYLFIIILIFACEQNNKRIEDSVIVQINLENTQNRESIVDFQNRFSINRIIPLETTDVSLLGYVSQIIVSEEGIFILDGIQNAIFRYDMDGNFTKKIHHQGQGPGEYQGKRMSFLATYLLACFKYLIINLL